MNKLQKMFLGLILFMVCSGMVPQNHSDSLFSASELTLKTATGDIYGTLTLPVGTEKSPLVLIIPGSGPTDRDCNSTLGIKTNIYKMLAEAFAANGIATVRFDKRGVAQSKPAMTAEADLRFETYINDVKDWITMLRADKRFSKIIVAGHSEGSLIGMVAAEQTDVAGFISLAGAGKPADQILKDQMKNRLTPQMMAETTAIIDSLKAGMTVTHVEPAMNVMFRPSVQPYLISWMKYDPTVEIAKLKIPVMIVQGSTDIQVNVTDANLLFAAKPDARLLIVDNMNHILKEAPADFKLNAATYQQPDLPLKAGLTEELIAFINSIK